MLGKLGRAAPMLMLMVISALIFLEVKKLEEVSVGYSRSLREYLSEQVRMAREEAQHHERMELLFEQDRIYMETGKRVPLYKIRGGRRGPGSKQLNP